MLWLLLSIMTAIAAASQDAWTKKFFGDMPLFTMAVFPLFYSLPFLALGWGAISRPPLDEVFFWCLAVSIPLNAVAFVLYMKAIKTSPLSLTVPYLAFTPTFMIFTGFVFLGEMPDVWGIAGILTTCVGSYVINIDPRKAGFMAPIRAIGSEKGSLTMLFVAFLYSFAAVIGKKGILHSSPLFFSISFFGAFNVLLVVSMFLFRRISIKTLLGHPFKGMLVGGILFVHLACHSYAITMVKAAYMISVKRTSILFGILYGAVLFNEGNIMIRFWGGVCMLAGAVMIVIMAG